VTCPLNSSYLKASARSYNENTQLSVAVKYHQQRANPEANSVPRQNVRSDFYDSVYCSCINVTLTKTTAYKRKNIQVHFWMFLKMERRSFNILYIIRPFMFYVINIDLEMFMSLGK
jgi:hypothetical protein